VAGDQGSRADQGSAGGQGVAGDEGVAGDQQFVVWRTTEDAVDHEGRRYLSGRIHLRWQAGQHSQLLVIGFVPAFQSEPSVEFESDSPETSVRCINCTGTGMRLAVKRKNLDLAEDTALEWVAIESEESSAGQDGSDATPLLP
jgi:hypothetical protein